MLTIRTKDHLHYNRNEWILHESIALWIHLFCFFFNEPLNYSSIVSSIVCFKVKYGNLEISYGEKESPLLFLSLVCVCLWENQLLAELIKANVYGYSN